MKKLLVFLVTIGLILIISTASLAVVEVGGDARFWFTSNIDGNNTSSFVFDRLALFVNADFSEKNGIKSEFGFIHTTNGNVLDHAYYYQKNLFTADELDIGYLALDQYYNQNTISLKGNLASQLPPSGLTSTGLKYSLIFDKFEACLAILNANDLATENEPGVTGINGYEQFLRITFLPVKNLAVGAGYLTDKEAGSNSDSYLTVDLTYQINPFSIYLEYDSLTPQGAPAQSGFYFEGAYKIKENFAVYLGGAFGTKDSGLLPSDYSCVGAKVQLAPQTELQGEYLIYAEGANNNSLNVRLKVIF